MVPMKSFITFGLHQEASPEYHVTIMERTLETIELPRHLFFSKFVLRNLIQLQIFNRTLVFAFHLIGGKPRDTSRNFPRLNYFKAQVLFRKICHTLQKSGDHLFCGPKNVFHFISKKRDLKIYSQRPRPLRQWQRNQVYK